MDGKRGGVKPPIYLSSFTLRSFLGTDRTFFNATLEAEQKNNNTPPPPENLHSLYVVINLNLINNAWNWTADLKSSSLSSPPPTFPIFSLCWGQASTTAISMLFHRGRRRNDFPISPLQFKRNTALIRKAGKCLPLQLKIALNNSLGQISCNIDYLSCIKNTKIYFSFIYQ